MGEEADINRSTPNSTTLSAPAFELPATEDGLMPSRSVCLLLAVQCFVLLVTLYFFWPGFLSHDSVSQYDQARTGAFDDWHPPLMALIWRWLLNLSNGPEMMLLLQLTMLHVGTFCLGYSLIKRGGWGWAFVPLALFLPPIFSISGVIWKDILFGAAMVLAIGLIAVGREFSDRTSKMLVNTAAALSIIFALCMRYNGLPAVVPLLFLLLPARYKGRNLPCWLRIGLAGILVLLLTLISSRLVASITHPAAKSVHQFIYLYDLAGMQLQVTEAIIPEVARTENYSAQNLDAIFSPLRPDNIFFGPQAQLKYFDKPEIVGELGAAWRTAVRTHPGAYLRHRLEIFLGMLGAAGESCYVYHEGFDTNPWGLRLRNTPLHNWFYQHVVTGVDPLRYWNSSKIFMAVWFWLAAGVAALVYISINYGQLAFRREALALLCSSALFISPYFFVSLACDYRYSWWSVVSVALALLLLFVREKSANTSANVSAAFTHHT